MRSGAWRTRCCQGDAMSFPRRRFPNLAASATALPAVLLIAGVITANAAAYAQPSDLRAPLFAASPMSGPAPLPVNFSYPYTSGSNGWMMNVDFGDGSSGHLERPPPPPCSHSPAGVVSCPPIGPWYGSHAYASPGTYTATLTRGELSLCATCSAPVLGSVKVTVTSSP